MAIIFVIIPLVIYFYAAITASKTNIIDPDQYFIAFRKVDETAFTSSSIAYGFQVSSIYPFILWGASLYVFIPLINSLFWGVGIWLFLLSFNKVSKYTGTGKTLPGIIGDQYGQYARITSALLTVVGFIGYAVAELWFGSRVLLAVFSSNFMIYIFVLIFVLFVGSYLFRGGQISSIMTDQLQLLFAYFGIFGIAIYLLYLTLYQNTFIIGPLFWGLLLMSVASITILLLRKFKFIAMNVTINKIINFVVVAAFLSITIIALYVLAANKKSYAVGSIINVDGFGYLGLLSLIILPLGWQFVDLTNWQRILSVETPDGTKAANKTIKNGLLKYSVESPFTWIFFIVLGMLIIAAFPSWSLEDILIDFPKKLINSDVLLEQALGYLFIASILSIMLSTVDSFIMGISFTFTYDIDMVSRAQLDYNYDKSPEVSKRIINRGKYFGGISILSAVILFIIFDNVILSGGILFINLLLTFYSAVLSLLPRIIGMLYLSNPVSPKWANLSMWCGSLSGILIGVYAVIISPNFAWYPVVISVGLSSLIYGVGILWGRYNYAL